MNIRRELDKRRQSKHDEASIAAHKETKAALLRAAGSSGGTKSGDYWPTSGPVKQVKPGLMREAKNERERRRVDGAKNGSAARRAMAWAETQLDKGPTIKVNTYGK